MKKWRMIFFFVVGLSFAMANEANAQCSICTKTAGQMGEKKATGLNSGIVYLMLTPFVLAGFIGYKWWRGEKESQSTE